MTRRVEQPGEAAVQRSGFDRDRKMLGAPVCTAEPTRRRRISEAQPDAEIAALAAQKIAFATNATPAGFLVFVG